MSVKAPVKKEPRMFQAHISESRLWLAVVAFFGILVVLCAYRLPPWQSLLWAAAVAAAIPLRLTMGQRAGVVVERVAIALMPLVGFTMVELLNYNAPWKGFTPTQIILNLCWYYLAAWILYLICARPALAAGLALGLFFFIGMANRYVIRFRGRTIFPGDLLTLTTAANVAAKYDYSFDALQLGCLMTLVLCVLLLTKLPARKGRRLPRLPGTLTLSGLCLAFVGVFFFTGIDTALGIEPSMWTTRGNGFVLNFTVCLKYSTVSEPEGYSPETAQAIAQESVEAFSPQTPAPGTRPENLIVVMGESLADLTVLDGLTTNEDAMPFIRGLSENTVKGTAYASVFGGTTANSEYEFLTGNTTAFLPEGTVPFQMYVTDEAPSLVGQVKDLGYATVAMHPYLSSGWNRIPVYQDFGFDQSLFQQDFQPAEKVRTYISDQSNFENVIRIYEDKEAEKPLFVFNVTMQNHSSYNLAWTNLPKSVWLTDQLQGKYTSVDQYLSLIRATDNSFQYLVDYFAQEDEPTMIVLFGDHQPQVSTNFYTQMLGGQFENLDTATQQKRQAVPFLIWANYDIPEAEGLELSLNYLSSLVAQTANLPLTGYQRYLAQLWQEIPVINAVGTQDSDGQWHEREETLSQQTRAKLEEYKILQYNQLFDDKHLVEKFFT